MGVPVKWRMARYRVVRCDRSANRGYAVQRKKWHQLFWHRCRGLQESYDCYDTIEEAKKSIPLYDNGSAYWLGTMVDLTKERLGVKTDG